MAELLSSGRTEPGAFRRRFRPRPRRRRVDFRTLATGVALFIAVAWTIVFGAGVLLR